MKNKIVAYIRTQVRRAGAKGIVLGLSGGLDSSVVSVLAKEALGKKKVLALILPCDSSASDLKDAKMVAKKFDIPTKIVDLSGAYNHLIKILPSANKVAQSNIKPRLRMLALYYFANKLNYLVCGTSNKSEIITGYFTKYGDGAADILPIGGLFKKQVKVLAKELGLPEQIIAKPASAGLWPGQTDEGEMGITYAELDDILERLEKRKVQILPAYKVNKVKEMIRRSEHKRLKPRVCVI